ncbi:hypothetical protein [Polaromonas sp. JS666]|uniref:hypothetical protein n=1 Tax=Polaromonas sp. (strain JS666 / ATCC BAA-500) TaxID=296591 RepID=UPI00087F8490|nr:hypothetical protein [Polaromonas sp. JS666]SDN51584.1 hypothetical protein SAMN05720382_105307 [Polaromonas sp. JS666]
MAINTETLPPSLEERYGAAAGSSNLRLDENRRGAVNLLIAAGVAARGEQKGSRVLGGALQRLLTEWEQVAKPQRMPAMSFKAWIDALPLIKVGEREGRDGEIVPIMGRDKEGARRKRDEQQKQSELMYGKELMLLAQKLPSRFLVREILFAVAVQWGCEEPEEVVAAAIAHWLASKCQNCQGTGSVQAGDKIRTCDKCHGSTQARVPGGDAGHRMVDYMDLCRVTWLGAFKQSYREIHKTA